MTLLTKDPYLLYQFRRGGELALERVYHHYLRGVRACVAGELARRPQSGGLALDDLVQEVFVRAFSTSARVDYDGVRPYAPYLNAIARNLVAAEYRHSRRETVADPVTLIGLVPGNAIPARAAAESADHAAVTALVQALPADLRAVYATRFEADKTQMDAAEALGMTRQNLRTLEQKLLQAVRRALRD